MGRLQVISWLHRIWSAQHLSSIHKPLCKMVKSGFQIIMFFCYLRPESTCPPLEPYLPYLKMHKCVGFDIVIIVSIWYICLRQLLLPQLVHRHIQITTLDTPGVVNVSNLWRRGIDTHIYNKERHTRLMWHMEIEITVFASHCRTYAHESHKPRCDWVGSAYRVVFCCCKLFSTHCSVDSD